MTIGKKAKYLEDYQIVKQAGQRDKLVYQGNYYSFQLDNESFCRYKHVMLCFSLLHILFWFIATFSNPSSLRGETVLYVSLPYVGLCFPLLLGLGRSIHMQRLAQNIERMDYDQCVVSLNLCTLISLIISLFSTVAQVVYILLHRAYDWQEWLAAIAFLGLSTTSWISYRLQARFPCANIGHLDTDATV